MRPLLLWCRSRDVRSWGVAPSAVGLTVDQAAIVGVVVIRLHDLRHTRASHLLMAGIHVKVDSGRLGYASVSFTFDTTPMSLPANTPRQQRQPLSCWESDG